MKITIAEKINTINKPALLSYTKGQAVTIEEFWEKFVAPNLPKSQKEIDNYITWYRLILDYCNDDDAVFAIRIFSTPCGGAKNYSTLRRGFFTKTNQHSFFYTDNYFAAYFLKMAMDADITPTYSEFKELMLSRRFPARFGPFDSKYEKKKAAYIINGKNPGFTTSGYKIAHIVDTGMNFNINGKKTGIADICSEYFPRGKYSDWKLQTDSYGEHYVRTLDNQDDISTAFLKAHFLRFACPLNYVLTPKNSCHTAIGGDIAENPAFQQYAQEQFVKLFGDIYVEYLDKLMLFDSPNIENPGKVKINIEYDVTMSADDDLADFAVYAIDYNGRKHNTVVSYKNYIHTIMRKMDITTIDDLNLNIDKAIDYCAEKIIEATDNCDPSTKKLYNDYRSALRKYKKYLQDIDSGIYQP